MTSLVVRTCHEYARSRTSRWIVVSPDDSKVVKVAPSALSAKVFFERDDDGSNVISVPTRREDLICETQGEQRLYHFLSEVMINPIDLSKNYRVKDVVRTCI